MGLDTSHNCWHGPYSSFNRFRRSLAQQIGLNLDEYIGYGKDSATKKLNTIRHPLRPLFNHSDCDGKLTVKQCEMIVKGLDIVLSNFNDKIEADYGFKEKIIQFKDGCMLAIENNEPVIFH